MVSPYLTRRLRSHREAVRDKRTNRVPANADEVETFRQSHRGSHLIMIRTRPTTEKASIADHRR